MDGVDVSVLRRSEPPMGRTTDRAEPRTLRVAAIFVLSENGRKASLIAGGNGRAEQVVDVDVPANRLHLVTVDPDGKAWLKLRPRYDTKPDGRVGKIDSPPVFDVPPSLDELFLVAAKTHELERAYITQGSRRGRDREDKREIRARLAEVFLRSPELRAAEHPTPSKKRCYLINEGARLLFDADRDEPPAREVPAEAHRRFRADERAKRERNAAEHARRIEVHEEKMRFIAEWIAAHGSADQAERQAAGLLPVAEAIEAIADAAFAPLHDWPRYERNGAAVLQAHIRQHPNYRHAVVSGGELAVNDANATEATTVQWHAVQRARSLLPNATVTLRAHRLMWKSDANAPSLTVFGVLLVVNSGPITVRREFRIPLEVQTEFGGNTQV